MRTRPARMAMAGRLAIAALLIPSWSCATRGVAPEMVAELGRARALLLEGCFVCLQEAGAIYERLARADGAPGEVHRGAFDTAVLLTVRARELGLPDTAYTARVVELATRVAPDARRPPPQVYLDVLQLVAGELSGVANEERLLRQAALTESWRFDAPASPARAALAPAVASDPVAQYLVLAVECQRSRGRDAIDADAVLSNHASGLLRFRLAVCGIQVDQLAALRLADPRWTDTLYFEGRFEARRYPVPDLWRAAELFAAAREAFPDSSAIALALAQARNALAEHDAALVLFEEVLARQPTHREALLGRVLSLSYLGRHYAAIRAATEMIDLGTYLLGDAYYWRAWNRYHVQDLDAAREDVERATSLMVSSAVYTLAGAVALARREFNTAIDHLVRAYDMDRTNCDAVWTEGLAHVGKEDWRPASARFVTAVECYQSAAERARDELAAARGAAGTSRAAARRAVEAEKQRAAADSRRAQAAINAAGCFARLGERDAALRYAAIAAQHPPLKDKAHALIEAIQKRHQ